MEDYRMIDQYLEEHLEDSLAELSVYCAQPSIAAQNLGILECASLVMEMLKKRGFSVELMKTKGAPVVYAERKGKSSKTLLFYNHYDVQPPEPINLWDSPPFEGTIKDGKYIARGASDNKGHLVSRLFAIDALLQGLGDLPCNIKFLVEGEEEIGSIHLPEFIREHAGKFTADACIWEFGGVDEQDVPIQTLGMRGICYVELHCKTAEVDVHSGWGGSIFPNAAWRLVQALNTLRDEEGTILIPGFYDAVQKASDRDKKYLAALPDPTMSYKKRSGIKSYLKDFENGLAIRIAEVFEPTCTICGLTSGYQGKGSKTVIPAEASAKIDFRMVPDQTPELVLKQLRDHLDRLGFTDIMIHPLGGEAPGRTDLDAPFIRVVDQAALDVYGCSTLINPMTGGSGPNHAFLKYLKVPITTAGIGYPGSKTHAPNENFRIDLYLKGAKHITRVLNLFAK